MSYVFKRAVRERTPLFLGLVGPSGSGKTFSALRLAAGIQAHVGGKIVGIDTEARRMLHYADRFEFDHLQLDAPFGPLRYKEAIEAAIAHGAKTIIVDSMSHEHEGPGGHLDTHEKELDRLSKGDSSKRDRVQFLAWAKPAGDRRKLINFILQCQCNFIFCFRAKEKIKLVKGNKEPVDLGWQAIAGEEFVYEMLCRFLLLPNSKGIPTWAAEHSALGVPKITEGLERIFSVEGHQQLDEWTGRQLARWAEGVAPSSDAPKPEPATGAGGDDAPSFGVRDAMNMIEDGDFQGAADVAKQLGGDDEQTIMTKIREAMETIEQD